MGVIILTVALLDLYVIGMLTLKITDLFGDTVSGRLLKVILIPTLCLGYLVLMIQVNEHGSLLQGYIVFFGPIGLAILLSVSAYVAGFTKER